MRIITIYALVTLVDKLVGYDSDEDFLNDNCISSNQCNSMVPNSVCMRGKCQCPNSNAIVSNGKPFCPLQRSKGDHDEDDSEEDRKKIHAIESKLKPNCLQKMPGDPCHSTEECTEIGGIEYHCIANICQMPPDCPPGHATIGSECVPYSVTGGKCSNPAQCLSGSICIHGKCRGPCGKNQLLVEDKCIDYEGAGCIAIGCMAHKCPRAFPVCNFIQQRQNYLCCERSMRDLIKCPRPESYPQMNSKNNEPVKCIRKGDKQCLAGFSCQFSSYGHGSYICCSNGS